MFTQKEMSLLKDAKEQEQLCVDKYKTYSAKACDEQLKDLFSGISENEQQHLDTINQMIAGTTKSMADPTGGRVISGQAHLTDFSGGEQQSPEEWEHDKYLCQDSLATEKYVSSVYNTSVFEFCDPQIRDTLNHIQKEEQNHGEQIFKYMASRGMYNPK